jgi:hypothetical protein
VGLVGPDALDADPGAAEMTIHAFPIPTGTRVSAFGRDDAVVTSQSGQTVHVVCLDGFGRAFTAAIPLSRLKLARRDNWELLMEGKLPARFTEDAGRPCDVG